MAKVSFNDLMQARNANTSNSNAGSGNNNRNSVGFFSLANNNDEAVVRFIEDSSDNFEILSVHRATVNGKSRSISCVRGDHDPINACPFCESGNPISRRIFIKMIQYIKNPDGTITAQPVMWERPANFAFTLQSYIDNYGPLSDIVCKVIRHGVKNDVHTTYEIVPNLSKAIYRDDLYVCDKTPFQNYTVLGRIVMDRTADEISQYLATGDFPMRQRNDAATATLPFAENVAPTAPSMPESISENVAYTAPAAAAPAGFTPAPAAEPVKMPWETATPQNVAPTAAAKMPWEQPAAATSNVGGVARPARYY